MVTDIAPEMIERYRRRFLRDLPMQFAVLDGECGSPPVMGFDLIYSSLAFQRFDDLRSAITRMLNWLAQGGQLIFTALASQTFRE